MTKPEVLLSCLLALAWLWRIGSSMYSSYTISVAITPSYFGNGVKIFITALQIITEVILDLMPLSGFPRISLAHRIMGIPSQAYTLYYANKYIGPTLDSRRVTILIYVISILCFLETVYKINSDWSRIE